MIDDYNIQPVGQGQEGQMLTGSPDPQQRKTWRPSSTGVGPDSQQLKTWRPNSTGGDPDPQQRLTWRPNSSSPTGGGGGFFSDPSLRFLEDAIRGRMGQVGTPLPNSLPNMENFQQLLGQFGGSAHGGGSGSPDVLGAFRSFVAGFQPNVASGFASYAAGRDPNAATAGLNSYAAGRDPQAATSQLQSALAGMGPNTSLPALQQYLSSRNPDSAAAGLQSFASGLDPLGGYESSLASRVGELRGNPFDDTYLAARRNAAFGDIEEERQVEKDRALEDLASRGIDASSGVLDRSTGDINARYDRRRSSAQNALVQEEFQLREQRNAQADALESNGAQLRMQSTGIAASLAGQIAQLQQQGLSMTDALQTSVAQLGIQDRGQQQAILTTVAQLQQQGMQMQDALQVAVTTAGLQSQSQADQLRFNSAQLGLQEEGMRSELQQNLAGLSTQQRGQDIGLQASLAQTGASTASSQLGALMNYMGMQQDNTRYNDERQGSAVSLAALIDQLVRQGLLDVQGNQPQLR